MISFSYFLDGIVKLSLYLRNEKQKKNRKRRKKNNVIKRQREYQKNDAHFNLINS